MEAQLVDGFEAIAPALLTGSTVPFEIGDLRCRIPEKLLISTPSSIEEALRINHLPAINRAIQDVKSATSNIGAFNTVFHMLIHGRSSMEWATRMPNQSKSSEHNASTTTGKTTETANLNFDTLFDSIKLAVNIRAPTVRDPLCSEFTDEFRYVRLAVSEIRKLFESEIEFFHDFILLWIFGCPRSDDQHVHCMRVVEEALQLEGFAVFMQQKLEYLQEKLDMNAGPRPDVRFMMDLVGNILVSGEEGSQEVALRDDHTQQKKRKAGSEKKRYTNKKKKAAKKAPGDEAWLKTLLTGPQENRMEEPAAQGNTLGLSNIITIFSTAPVPVDVVPAVAPRQEEASTVPSKNIAGSKPGRAGGQKTSERITLKFPRALLSKSPQAPESTRAAEGNAPSASQPTQLANTSIAQIAPTDPAQAQGETRIPATTLRPIPSNSDPVPGRTSYHQKKGVKLAPDQQLYPPESSGAAVGQKPKAKRKPKTKAPTATSPTRVWAREERRRVKAPDRYEG